MQPQLGYFNCVIESFSAVQELSGFFGHQCYTEVSVVQGSVVQGPSVLYSIIVNFSYILNTIYLSSLNL